VLADRIRPPARFGGHIAYRRGRLLLCGDLLGRARRCLNGAAWLLLISIDGMHSIDLTNFLNDSAHLASTLKTLSNNAVIYPNAYTPAPSDSFPGMIAQVTGGTPKSTGVFYDESYDRTLFAPG
jgi:hypothetical protein